MRQTVPAIAHRTVDVASHDAVLSNEGHVVVRLHYLTAPSIIGVLRHLRKVSFRPCYKIGKMLSVAFRAFHANLVVFPSDDEITIFWIWMSGLSNVYIWVRIVIYDHVVVSLLRGFQCDTVCSPV